MIVAYANAQQVAMLGGDGPSGGPGGRHARRRPAHHGAHGLGVREELAQRAVHTSGRTSCMTRRETAISFSILLFHSSSHSLGTTDRM